MMFKGTYFLQHKKVQPSKAPPQTRWLSVKTRTRGCYGVGEFRFSKAVKLLSPYYLMMLGCWGRKVAQNVVDGCIICWKMKAVKCKQVIGDLSPEITEPVARFKYTAVDLFGPHQKESNIKGLLYCRAFHTQVVNSLSTEGFLLVYQRFTAIQPRPRKVRSDPGPGTR